VISAKEIRSTETGETTAAHPALKGRPRARFGSPGDSSAHTPNIATYATYGS
jgi:hypothetical protein